MCHAAAQGRNWQCPGRGLTGHPKDRAVGGALWEDPALPEGEPAPWSAFSDTPKQEWQAFQNRNKIFLKVAQKRKRNAPNSRPWEIWVLRVPALWGGFSSWGPASFAGSERGHLMELGPQGDGSWLLMALPSQSFSPVSYLPLHPPPSVLLQIGILFTSTSPLASAGTIL